MPPLILALCVILLLGMLNVPSFMNSRQGQAMPPAFFLVAIFSVLTFWHNVLMQVVGYFNYCLNIYWSLSVEEVFYLTFPLACALLKRDLLIIALCIAAIVFGPVYRSVHTDNEIYFMYAYPACFDAIAFGCLAAVLHGKLQIGPRVSVLIRYAAGVGLAFSYFAGIDGHEIFGFSWIAVCVVGLLTNAFDAPARQAKYLPSRWLCWLGRHSYELYLFHIILLAGMRDMVPKANAAVRRQAAAVRAVPGAVVPARGSRGALFCRSAQCRGLRRYLAAAVLGGRRQNVTSSRSRRNRRAGERQHFCLEPKNDEILPTGSAGPGLECGIWFKRCASGGHGGAAGTAGQCGCVDADDRCAPHR